MMPHSLRRVPGKIKHRLPVLAARPDVLHPAPARTPRTRAGRQRTGHHAVPAHLDFVATNQDATLDRSYSLADIAGSPRGDALPTANYGDITTTSDLAKLEGRPSTATYPRNPPVLGIGSP